MFNKEKIKVFRQSLKLTQHQFAQKLGPTFTAQQVSNWELGKDVPSGRSLGAIAKAYNKSIDYFFT